MVALLAHLIVRAVREGSGVLADLGVKAGSAGNQRAVALVDRERQPVGRVLDRQGPCVSRCHVVLLDAAARSRACERATSDHYLALRRRSGDVRRQGSRCQWADHG